MACAAFQGVATLTRHGIIRVILVRKHDIQHYGVHLRIILGSGGLVVANFRRNYSKTYIRTLQEESLSVVDLHEPACRCFLQRAEYERFVGLGADINSALFCSPLQRETKAELLSLIHI